MVAFDLMMKIVIMILQILVRVSFDMIFYLLGQHFFSSLATREQIDHKNTFILLYDFIHMLFVSLMGNLKSSINFSLSVQTYLLKENRKTSSNLQITKHILVDFYNLFGFTKVGYISFIIDTSIEISSASFFSGSSSDKHVLDFGSLIEKFKTADKTLDNRCFPMLAYLVLIEL